VLVAGFPAAAFGTNCYVVAPAAGERCVVVDPGVGVAEHLDEVLSTHRLQPAAVLLTHGHIDHTFSVTPVCGANDVPAYIHPDDADLLSDPARGFGPAIEQMFAGGLLWTEPADVRPLPDDGPVQIAGMAITVDHAPGHTTGSVLFQLPAAEDSRDLVLSGDVLFAGSIGRTDLPGGDYTAMMRSLATKILPLADETVVLPGHGPRTTIGRERTSNPYLAEAARTAAVAKGM
jgi:hydroxyacylglutathione hydrolase